MQKWTEMSLHAEFKYWHFLIFERLTFNMEVK